MTNVVEGWRNGPGKSLYYDSKLSLSAQEENLSITVDNSMQITAAYWAEVKKAR